MTVFNDKMGKEFLTIAETKEILQELESGRT